MDSAGKTELKITENRKVDDVNDLPIVWLNIILFTRPGVAGAVLWVFGGHHQPWFQIPRYQIDLLSIQLVISMKQEQIYCEEFIIH